MATKIKNTKNFLQLIIQNSKNLRSKSDTYTEVDSLKLNRVQ